MKKYFLLGALIAIIGCSPQDQITTQQVPKEKSGYLALRQAPKATSNTLGQNGLGMNGLGMNGLGMNGLGKANEPVTPTDRMLVAIYRSDETDWFYKVDGPIAAIESAQEQLMNFFESASFEKGKPVWKLPEGWTVGDEKPMRFATLKINLAGNEEPESGQPVIKGLELAISSLSGGQDLLLNVNRWRGQMSLPPTTQDKLEQDLKPLGSIPKAFLFSITGKKAGGMMGGMGMGGGMPDASRTGPGVAQNLSASAFDLAPPEGWTAGKTSVMVPLRFQKSEKESTVQITVTQLPAAANTWGPNVTRWAGEAEMLELTDEELKSLSSTIEIDSTQGDLVRLVSEDEKKNKGVVGAMVKQGESAWFVKLSGDKKLVVESEPVFLDLLKKLKFPK